MLRWFRLQASRIATVAMCGLASVGVSAVTPHADDCHDAACGAAAVQHDEGDHRYEAVPSTADQDPLHCLVCHWTRSFRPHVEYRVLPAPATAAGAVVTVESAAVLTAALAAQPPLRAPPARSLVA